MNRLSLVGRTMLLVALERPDGFELPFKRAARWYGLSAHSASSGLRELHTHKLVDVEHTWVRDARSDTGWAPKYIYTLTGPFSTAAQEEAAGRRPAVRADGDLDEENRDGDQKHINAEEDTEPAPAASPTDHKGSGGNEGARATRRGTERCTAASPPGGERVPLEVGYRREEVALGHGETTSKPVTATCEGSSPVASAATRRAPACDRSDAIAGSTPRIARRVPGVAVFVFPGRSG